MGHYTIDRAAVSSLPGYPPIDAQVHGCAVAIYDDSQALVPQPGGGDDPYATGELKASGFVDGHASEYRIGYGTDHAVFVEFGTRYMNAEPFLGPAAVRPRGAL